MSGSDEHTLSDGRSGAEAHGPVETRVRAADLWRATGIGLSLVWAVVLLLVVGYAARLTFAPTTGDPPGFVRLLLAPLSLVALALFVWLAIAGWRIQARRTAGWDAIVVVGGLALASGVFVAAPWRFDGGPGKGLTPLSVGLVVLGTLSVVAGLLAQRAWRRAAVALEQSHAGGVLPGPGEDALG